MLTRESVAKEFDLHPLSVAGGPWHDAELGPLRQVGELDSTVVDP